jgi:hypothetical protein
MRASSSNLFHTSLAFHPSSLTARTSKRGSNRRVASQWCTTTGSRYGIRGMDSSSWGVVSIALRRITLGGNA